ncbi:MAG: imidazoleglycerol-phosphate dehydratase HisB [Lachnospiraceae bacterium]|jgi:imidazoleglycerol-phosphate dehydratase|nr:imidazoleglycerol-phosphate dehydratase HisB [Lachnospiraceae bacterium]MCI1726718.1 imidazoleglycerol-phosphate dehydratase HisB [Lachnospiraceae bacterium]
MGRRAEVKRTTKETDITVSIDLDGTGKADISTGIGFFDHMLEAVARHGFFDLTVKAKGDLQVDAHHTIEDTGIVLGQAIAQAVGDKKGIRRYGYFVLPMDETLVVCAVDLCGRAYYASNIVFSVPMIGEFETEMMREFFLAVANNAQMNLHIRKLDGFNNHHLAEASFKAFAKALDMATSVDPRITDVLSTKGTL